MAGPYYTTIKSTDGRVLNVYHAGGDAIAKYLNLEQNGAATSTSPQQFTIRPGEPFTIADWYTTVVDASPAHQLEIIKDDDPKGRFFVCNSAMAPTNTARVVQNITLTPGTYKLRVVVACPA